MRLERRIFPVRYSKGFGLNFVQFFFCLTEDEYQWLLPIFSTTDLVGRLAPGWIAHMKLASDKSLYIVSITMLGVCMTLITLARTFVHFVLVSLLCGAMTGFQMVLSPAILSDYMGVENTAIAFGMSNFLCGAFTLAFRPMAIGECECVVAFLRIQTEYVFLPKASKTFTATTTCLAMC